MARTQLSRTPLSTQAGVLRASLLFSLGLSPLACGGSTVTASDANGGASARAGAENAAGAPAQGGAGAENAAGAPAQGGAGEVGGASARAGGAAYAGAPSGGAPAHAGAPSGGAGGAAGGASPLDLCPNPIFDAVSKLIVCSNGRQHRAQALECTYTVPPAGAAGAGGAGAGGAASNAGAAGASNRCASDADCGALPFGYCEENFGNAAYRTCRSGCSKDSDCSTGICICNGTNPGRCTIAGCTTDADCGPNSLCAPAYAPCGPGSFQCTTPQDECITNADCGGSGTCSSNGMHRACNRAVCGRPFLIADSARMAAVEARADWREPTLSPNASELTPVERAQLAAHWARLGQMEHASIAAFARFNLQLLALGAPSDLIEACNHALVDETAHTRACFALASAYGGIPVGPARLDIEHCFEDTSLGAIAKLVLREGCLGETVASLEALAAAEAASDPAVKRALTRIAQDELQHAELAFKFVRWALAQTPAETRDELAREAAQQLADFESEARHGQRTRTDDKLAAHGLLASDALRAIHLAAVRDVARPLLAALFEVELLHFA